MTVPFNFCPLQSSESQVVKEVLSILSYNVRRATIVNKKVISMRVLTKAQWFLTIRSNDITALREILAYPQGIETFNTFVNCQDSKGHTALYSAAANNHL
jgi:hypothetical protein